MTDTQTSNALVMQPLMAVRPTPVSSRANAKVSVMAMGSRSRRRESAKAGDSVSKTGNATAANGSIANTGIINITTTTPTVRSAYLRQVARIAPQGGLQDRAAELAELAAFCSEAGGESYAWWRAPAWAGKSSLMAWFALNPPPGVRVVSFFITARWAGHDNRNAFAEVVLEQLCEILGDPIPPYLSEATRDHHLLDKLYDAVEVCKQNGTRLVLLVDGLDEDRGVTSGPKAYSVSALLPDQPTEDMRIIVSGRPNPPIPTDVPDHHPLRDPKIVRTLTASPHAAVVRADMERELKHLLQGTELERDLLGLITAARGGLSSSDLAELTGESAWMIDQHLRTVAGRSFARREGGQRLDTGKEVYILGHEQLQQTAVLFLGEQRLRRYELTLSSWAARYRDRQWPEDTPEYLLRGYFRMLATTGNLELMISCATDPLRHARLLDVSGGDATALAEILTVQEKIVACDQPDLTAMARLAIHRDVLANRNKNMPLKLPAVWALLGHKVRAEALAGAIADPNRQVLALCFLIGLIAPAGDSEWVQELAERVELLTRSISAPFNKVQALSRLALAMAKVGDFDRADRLINRAERLAELVVDREQRAKAFINTAQAAGVVGNFDKAQQLAKRAPMTDERKADRLLALLRKLTSEGNIARAESILRRISRRSWRRNAAVLLVVEVLAYSGDVIEAERILYDFINPWHRSEAAAGLIQALASRGDVVRAQHYLTEIIEPRWRSYALVEIALSFARSQEVEKAYRFSEDAENVSRSMRDPNSNGWEFALLAKAIGFYGYAQEMRVVARWTEVTIRSMVDPIPQSELLKALVESLIDCGEVDLAKSFIDKTFDIVPSDHGFYDSVEALIRLGELDAADELARSSYDPDKEALGLLAVANAAARIEDRNLARLAIDRVEELLPLMTDYWGEEMVRLLVEAIGATGDFERATTLANDIGAHSTRNRAFQGIAIAAARRREFDLAEEVMRSIADSTYKAGALLEIVKQLAEIGAPLKICRLAADMVAPGSGMDTVLPVLETLAIGGRWKDVADMLNLIADPSDRLESFALVSSFAHRSGNFQRAGEISRRGLREYQAIAELDRSVLSVATIAKMMALSGDLDGAVGLARSIDDPQEIALLILEIAKIAPESRRPELACQAFILAHWSLPLELAASIDPRILIAVVDELKVMRKDV